MDKAISTTSLTIWSRKADYLFDSSSRVDPVIRGKLIPGAEHRSLQSDSSFTALMRFIAPHYREEKQQRYTYYLGCVCTNEHWYFIICFLAWLSFSLMPGLTTHLSAIYIVCLCYKEGTIQLCMDLIYSFWCYSSIVWWAIEDVKTWSLKTRCTLPKW